VGYRASRSPTARFGRRDPKLPTAWFSLKVRLLKSTTSYNMTMSHAIRVDSHFATAHDTARILGVSKSRTEALIKIARRYTDRILKAKPPKAGAPAENGHARRKSAATSAATIVRVRRAVGAMPAQKSPRQNRRRLKPAVEKVAVFLNIPYDSRFENLLLAYIAGIGAFGFAPRATLEIPFSQRRLDRIISLIASS
jgi:hypothetical protein